MNNQIQRCLPASLRERPERRDNEWSSGDVQAYMRIRWHHSAVGWFGCQLRSFGRQADV